MSAAHRSLLWMLAFVALTTVVEMMRALLHGGYSDFQLVWTRYGVHVAFMLIVFGRGAPKQLFETKRVGFQLARSMMMLIMPASFIVGIKLGGNAASMWQLFWLAPLMILVMARVFLSESAHISLWIAAFIAFAGASLLTATRQTESLAPNLCSLLMALSFSTYVVMTRSLRTERAATNLLYSALGVFVALTPLMFVVWRTPTVHDFGIMSAIGLLGLLSLFAVDRMTSLAPVSVSAPVVYWQVLLLFGGMRGFGSFTTGRRIPVAIAAIALATLIAWMGGDRMTLQEQT